MCGRFTQEFSWAEIRDMYNLTRPEDRARNMPPRYNIAPTQDVNFVAEVDGERRLLEGRWWLVPHWAKEIPKYSLFNARSEDAHTKPAFRDAFRHRRCLVPADGYYEWTKGADGGKDPHLIFLPGREAFSFAGLWAVNDALGITSFTILTAPAAPEIAHLHDRMPVILDRTVYDGWLDRNTSLEGARELLAHTLGAELTSYRVSRAVNNSRAQGKDLTERV